MKAKVTLLARLKVDGAWGFERVLTEKNGRPCEPRPIKYASCYYLRYVDENGKRVTEPVGSDFDAARTAFLNRETKHEAEKRGVAVVLPDENPDRRNITEAIAAFLKNMQTLDRAPSTVYSYTRALELFRESCHKVYLDELTKQDVFDYIEHIKATCPSRDHGQRNGTLRVRLQFLKTFVQEFGVKFPLAKKEWPKVQETDAVAFESAEVKQLLSAATIDEADLILCLLCTGFRDNEVAHMFYSDIDFDSASVNIYSKADLKFRTKNGKAREVDITIPASLVQRLRDRRERNPEGDLIFPNSKGTVDTSLLTRVRKAADRANYTKHFGLHRFRKTFGTRYAETFGIKNAQKALGHADIATTSKYLAKTTIPAKAVEQLFADVTA